MSKKHQKFPPRFPRFAAGFRYQEAADKKWLGILEKMARGGRMAAGMRYAASGQVTKLDIQGAHVAASVVGTRPGTYEVVIDFKPLTAAQHKKIVKAIRAKEILVARLLANDLPMEVEQIFREAGAELYLNAIFSCSCPDWARPCKHTLAVLILLGEEVAIHPWRLLEFRGIKMEELYED